MSPRTIPILLFILCVAGCCKCPGPPVGYWGPIDPLPVVVQKINQNNSALPTLYAHHYLEANIHDPKTGKDHFINSNGDVFVLKPRDLLLRAKHDPIGEVFQIGSTDDRYWMSIFVEQDTMWWGWHRNSDKPCAGKMSIRPDLVGEVLGISELTPNLLDVPAVTMRFNNDYDVYMLVWNAKDTTHWYAQKEVWYDRQTCLPRKVLLFDKDGRIVLRANLSEHGPVEVPGRAREAWPKIATYYELFFPETKSNMTIRLSDMSLTTKNGNPKPGMIRFPEDPPVKTIIQIDQDCDQPTSK
jgi:hypothetical protein